MDFNTERPRGMLSPADRDLLLGEAEMGHEQSRRNAEARVRQRVIDSIKDFYLLVHTLKAKDRQQIFEKSVDDPEFIDGLKTMLSFVYLGLKETGIEFDHVLEPAVRKSEEAYAAETLGAIVDVETNFSVETHRRTEPDAVRTRIAAADPISPTELFSLVVAEGAVPDDVDTIVVQLGPDEKSHANDAFVTRLAEFLDADLEELPMNRLRFHL